MRIYAVAGFLAFLSVLLPLFANAKCVEPYCVRVQNTIPFGGKVLSVQTPGVTCIPSEGGTAPVVLSTNISGLVSAGISAASGNQTDAQRTVGTVSGLYRAIPLYTLSMGFQGDTLRQPKIGDWILGNQQIIPNISTCSIGEIPFPVVKTNNYGVSQPSALRR